MQIPFLPPPGINSNDSTFSARGRWADGNGFRFRGGAAETIGGAIEMANATAVLRANKMLVFDQSGTISLAVAGTTLRVGPIDAAGTDITPASGWTTTSGTRRCLQMWGNTLLASVSGGKLFESSGGAQATEIANAPDAITCMLVLPSRQVMALGCNEEVSGTFNGRCIRWSDIEDYTDWTTTATNNAGEYILPGQADIVSACPLGDYTLVWTEADMWLASFTGDPGQTFTFTRVGDAGISGLDAWAIYRQTVYWMGPDQGFYSYQLGGIPQRIPCPISDGLTFVDAVDRAQTFGCSVSRFGEIWFGVPVGASLPDQYFVFCVDESIAAEAPVWFKGTFVLAMNNAVGVSAMIDNPLLATGFETYQTTTIAYEGNASVAKKPWRWDCGQNASAAAQFGISGAYIQSSDFYPDAAERRLMISSFSPDFETQSGAVYLTVYARDRAMAEPVTKGPYTLAFSTQLANCLVNDTVASGDSVVTVDQNPEAMAAGVLFNFAGVNAWENGADTGSLRQFTVASDFIGGDGDISFTPAVVSSGASRNVVSLPANNAVISALTRKSKRDFRASGRVFAFKFATAGAFRVRFGKPVFDVVPMGER
jgi:hypothetical protein